MEFKIGREIITPPQKIITAVEKAAKIYQANNGLNGETNGQKDLNTAYKEKGKGERVDKTI